MKNNHEMYLWGLLNLLFGITVSLRFKMFGIVAIIIGVLFFVQSSWSRKLIKTLYWGCFAVALIKLFSLLFSTGFDAPFWTFFGYCFTLTVLMMVVIYRLNLQRSSAYFFGLADEKVDMSAGKEGWLCSNCGNTNKYSIRCWNCDTPKEDTHEPKEASTSTDDIETSSEEEREESSS